MQIVRDERNKEKEERTISEAPLPCREQLVVDEEKEVIGRKALTNTSSVLLT